MLKTETLGSEMWYVILLDSVSVRMAWHCSLKRPLVRQCSSHFATSAPAGQDFLHSLRSAGFRVNILWVDCGGI